MTTQQDHSTLTVDTAAGTVRGQWLDGVARFAGIPYAEAPVGALRFRAPQPRNPWQGVFDATEFGPIAPQNPSFMDLLFGLEPEPQSEDCLRLNIYTPDPGLSGDEALPVMFWIHGGAFEMGSGSTSIYDGTAFAKQGAVFVSINYRLGPLGFLELSGLDDEFLGSGNAGLLDQIEALRWVQTNIARFGGDPDNVTVFGESAGSMSTSLLMSSSLTDGLFHRAICQSGGVNAARDLEFARTEGAEVMRLGGWSSVTEAQNAPLADLLAVHATIMAQRWGNPNTTLAESGELLAAMAFRPVRDGHAVPTDPLAAIAQGAAAGVPLVIGHNRDEWRLFALLMPGAETEEQLVERATLLGADAATLIEAYRIDHPEASPAELECAIITDIVFRVPTAELAAAHSSHAPVWQYQFDWESPMLGAAHAVELPFVFSQLHDTRLAPLFGPEPPQQVADAMSNAWATFARDGIPSIASLDSWPHLPGNGSRPVVRFDVETTLDDNPLAASLAYWLRGANG
ncbi:MAG TPA: carboxylesterase family protein [Microthrixaceae bacterium]|nr:carboxylesterase family protein [Microthrixaceae bacterium]